MEGKNKKNIFWFKEISIEDVDLVGGKNASLGEMFSQLTKKGINVPNGFALTTNFYWEFLKANNLNKALKIIFKNFNPKSIKSIQGTGKKCREAIAKGEFPDNLKQEVSKAYLELSSKYGNNTDVAVRSSGVAEDRPNASFAGQFETYLNIKGEKELLKAVKKSIVSTFTDRAIAYREEKKIGQMEFGLSVGVQKMVRSDLASSGVIFTLDTETGFSNVVLINSIWGIGEMIVKGKITPDQFYVFKPTLEQGYKSIIVRNLGRKDRKYIYSKGQGIKEVKIPVNKQNQFSLNDEEVIKLAQWACLIEKHYNKPQDIEWAKDGQTGQLFIVQSRPETIYAPQIGNFYKEYNVKTDKKPLITGIAVGAKIGIGKVKRILDISDISDFKKGDVLVTKMTDPDWVPVMRLASAIITNEGGKTAHAAIVSRELGVPCIVGTKDATKILKDNQIITADCTQGSVGRVFAGNIPFTTKTYNLDKIPNLKTKIMINIGAPDIAFQTSFLPNDGVGLARMEFILAEKIRIHPLALYHFDKIKDKKVKREIAEATLGYTDKKEYFINKLSEGISQIAAAFWPKPVIVRLSDFKTNEYSSLIGGKEFEPEESNPMIGWRGASRYYDEKFKPAFEMECKALKRARDIFGLDNIWPMVPFCRTVDEGEKVIALMKKQGLERGKKGLKIIVMCEIPANVILIEEFLDIFDGMSIGSNDLTQLTLGLDRDSALLSKIGDERNEAVMQSIKKVIKVCLQKKKYVGICGQAPSDFPEFAQFLVQEGIESISLNPDTVIKTIINLAKIKNV
ncbi:phosphoenolpyruvate synthase [Patescibacteria group bacterium]|nr:phosphoenolpyruvate synthase [Patescibacteria group bacterium]MBU1877082.1 phosphoenolpyruvate synthase [Patescibacteria group bacterium]